MTSSPTADGRIASAAPRGGRDAAWADFDAAPRVWRAGSLDLAPPVFDRVALDELLWCAGAALTRDCRLVGPQPARQLPRAAGADLRDWARAGYLDGLSVVVNRLERHHPDVARFAAGLAERVDADVEVSAVLTPAQASAYPWHADADEVLVWQLDGRKHWAWRTHAEPVHEGFRVLDTAPPEAELHRSTLQPGDLLVLPRGWAHRAWTEATASLQLTVAVRPWRWVDALRDLIEALAQGDEVLRRRAAAVDVDALPQHLAGPSAAVLERVQALHARRRVAQAVTLPGGRLAADPAPVDAAETAVAGPLRKPPGTQCHVRQVAGRVALEWSGRRRATLRAPAWLEPALRVVAGSRGPITPDGLPDELDDAEKALLIGRLLAEDFLEPLR